MDLTIEAIEQDLVNAEARAGQPIAAVYLKRAEIRATLMNGWNVQVTPDETTLLEPIGGLSVGIPDGKTDTDMIGIPNGTVILVPAEAPFPDRLEVAASLIALPRNVLASILSRAGFETGIGDPLADPDSSSVVVHVEEDSDVDDDFFAEAKRERKK